MVSVVGSPSPGCEPAATGGGGLSTDPLGRPSAELPTVEQSPAITVTSVAAPLAGTVS